MLYEVITDLVGALGDQVAQGGQVDSHKVMLQKWDCVPFVSLARACDRSLFKILVFDLDDLEFA